MRHPLKLVLPVVMGLVCGMLMVWDLHNQRIITSMGMAWDTGAPLWPYQTPDTLLFALNTPASLVSAASNYFFKFGVINPMQHYATLFPAILAWWWLIGAYLDRHREGNDSGKRRIRPVFLCLLAVALISVGAEESHWAFRWWWTYSRTLASSSDLILMRLLAPSIWCFVLGIASLIAWRRAYILRPPSS